MICPQIDGACHSFGGKTSRLADHPRSRGLCAGVQKVTFPIEPQPAGITRSSDWNSPGGPIRADDAADSNQDHQLARRGPPLLNQTRTQMAQTH